MKKFVSVVLLTMCLSTSAMADKKSSVASYNAGKREYNLGNFAKAISHFEAAYRAYEAPAYLYNIAQSYRQLENCKEALFFYNRFLTEDPMSQKAPVIRGYISELEAECGEATAPVATPPVVETTTSPSAQEYELAAQQHSASGQFAEAARAYEAAFDVTRDAKFIYLQAEAFRLGRLTVEAIGAYDIYLQMDPYGRHASLAHRRKSELEASVAAPQPQVPPPNASGVWTGRKKLALGLGAVGLVGLGIGSVFGLQAMGYKDDALDPGIGGCDSDFRRCNTTGVSRYDDAQAAATNSNIAFGLGIAASAAAVTLWLTAPSNAPEMKRGVSLSPSWRRDAMGFVIAGSY